MWLSMDCFIWSSQGKFQCVGARRNGTRYRSPTNHFTCKGKLCYKNSIRASLIRLDWMTQVPWCYSWSIRQAALLSIATRLWAGLRIGITFCCHLSAISSSVPSILHVTFSSILSTQLHWCFSSTPALPMPSIRDDLAWYKGRVYRITRERGSIHMDCSAVNNPPSFMNGSCVLEIHSANVRV